MNSKTILTGLVLLLLVGIPAAYMTAKERGTWDRGAADEGGELAFASLRDDESRVAQIELSSGAQDALILERGDGGWGLPAKGGYDVKEEKILELMRGLAGLELVEAKTSRPERHEKVGLVAPEEGGEDARLVRLLDSEGGLIDELLLGNRFFEATFPALFVRRPGDDQTYLARGEVAATARAQDWLESNLLSWDRERTARASVEFMSGGETGYAALRKTPSDYMFELEQVPVGMVPQSDYVVSGVPRMADNLRFADVLARGAIDESSALTHVRAKLETFDGVELTIDGYEILPEQQTNDDPGTAKVWITLSARLLDWAGTEELDPTPEAASNEGEGETAEAEQPQESAGPTRAELEAEVAELNSKFEPWIYEAEATTATALLRSIDDLVQAAPEPESTLADPLDAEASGTDG